MHAGPVLAVCLPLAALAAQAAPKEPKGASAAQQAQRFARELELPQKRAQAVDALLLLGGGAVPALLQQAQHPDLATARVALHVIAAMAHDGLAAVPKLRELGKGESAHAQAAAWTLARLPHRGTFLVPLMQEGVVVELDAAGKKIWRSTKLEQPWTASIVPGDRLLVAEVGHGAREYDAAGKRIAEFGTGNTYAAERLIDGNTLVGSYRGSGVVEYDAAGKEVWSHPTVWTLSVSRLPSGRTLLADYKTGAIMEVDAAGQTVWTVADQRQTYSCQRDRDGTWISGPQKRVMTKVDRDGNQVAELSLWGNASHAVKLPDGSIQAGEGFVRRFDDKGKELWHTEIAGNPGRITLR